MEENKSYSNSVFHPLEVNVNQDTLNYAEQVEKISSEVKEQNKIFQKEVEALLKWVTEDHSVKVEELLKKNPNLVICTGTVTDLSGRKFNHITALQYAAWSLNREMSDLLMSYLSEYNRAIQLKALYAESDRYSVYGDHYNIKPLLKNTRTYVENYKSWGAEQCRRYWQKEVGGEQMKCPAWLVYAWTEIGEGVAWAEGDFSKKVVKQDNKYSPLDWWFKDQRCRNNNRDWAGCRGSAHTLCHDDMHLISLYKIDCTRQEMLDKLGDEFLDKLKSLSKIDYTDTIGMTVK